MITHPTVLDLDAQSRRYTDLHQSPADPAVVSTSHRSAWAARLRRFVHGAVAARTARRSRAGSGPVKPAKA